MSFSKTYFLCPTSDFIHPPPAGSLCLGSIIRSTSAPQLPLNQASAVAVANPNPPQVETNWKKTVSAETGLGFGVYAQFLQLAMGGGSGIGPEVDVERSRHAVNVFTFDTMTTLSFEPTSQYVEEAVKAPAVQAWLREPRQRFSPLVTLFLVTGMKLVNGARIKYSLSGSTAITANLGVDVPQLGFTVGPKGRWSSTDDDETEFSRESEFIFAFRVKRLRIGRKISTEEYSKGAFLANGDERKDVHLEPVLVDDVDGSTLEKANVVSDATEDGHVYCVPA
ncbi:hypothetical protein CRV24_002565 [Beauveria bassiana]|uniref:Uncharacterized protein n=1 Tax=Beauveria bassiana (strain ARSEF 2860) TaxID=655819 RepID=J4WMS4_BEAB2|nr:uncharacterized protein BBA_00620 [Beauveria bassiana ARSEF 2860]EJP70990.1 hypothetical protein BBA_00620 [Beauveria bassiana ARSEF 2860]KAF1736952.1 hypothetical protein CRV24_002565 [Beauveria bassiana]